MKITKNHFRKLLRKLKKLFSKLKKPLRSLASFRREVKRRFWKLRVRKHVSIISRNCCGGVFYHDCMQKFLSPTIDLYFPRNDFVPFCMHLKEFINGNIVEKPDPTVSYPVGEIKTDFGAVEVRFMHYSTFEDAVADWRRRAKRVDYDKLCVVFDADADCPEALVRAFGEIPLKNKIMLTSGIDVKKYPYCFNMKSYENGYRDSLVYFKNDFSTQRYMYDFDFIRFINMSV